ncbi:hypothetical protein A3Q56_00446 [Intoshia linei]|uniref:BolA-like protein n=1 Tax=Intoshia linei TaxID=1819745 RepID=A0A177BDS8_9BILA|nr:hypothetical protein A3Q56_00446 [Intoshia linei]
MKEILDVTDDYKCGLKLDILIVSNVFCDESIINRNRLVHEAVMGDLPQIHTLIPRTFTPLEWKNEEITDVTKNCACGIKLDVLIVSSEFNNNALLNRHKMIHKAIQNELPKIHALTLNTYTPIEWENKLAKQTV